jgi:hypothetical protein
VPSETPGEVAATRGALAGSRENRSAIGSGEPGSPDWVHEIKHDGYRLVARRDPIGIRLITRNGRDWSPRYPLIVEAVNRLKVRSCLVDGEARWGWKASCRSGWARATSQAAPAIGSSSRTRRHRL